MTLGSVVIQDLTYTETQLGLDVAINYLNSDSLSISVSGHTINVNIVSGTTTAAAIKAAVDANIDAHALVTIVVSGTGTNAQVTCNQALIASGVTTAVAASQVIGTLKYTAQTAGSAGNSIRVKYTSGSLLVSVATNDITIRFVDGVTTASDIKAAVAASSPANALVSVVSNGPALSNPQFIASAPAFINLVGGLDTAQGTVVIQDLTFSTDNNTDTYNGKSVSYSTGATAGAEVVTVSSGNIDVQIENGVSTATQIKTACDASADFNGVTASGQITVTNYAQLHLTKAAGTVTFGTPDNLTAATPSGTITFGTPAENSTVVLTGLPTDGTKTYTKSTAVANADATAEITIDDYTKLIKQAAVLTIGTINYTANIPPYDDASGNGINIEYVSDLTGDQAVVEVNGLDILVHMDDTAVTGTIGNTIRDAINLDPEASLLVDAAGTDLVVQSVTAPTYLTGGQSDAIVTVNSYVLTQGIDFAAEIDDSTTAENIANALDLSMGEEVASNIAEVVTYTVPGSIGAAGNGQILSYSGDVAGITIDALTAGGATEHILTATEFETIAQLTTLINGLTDLNASDDSTDITLVVATAGTSMNSATITGTSSYSALSITFSGGKVASTITVDGNLFTKVAAGPGAGEFAVIADLTTLINNLASVDATDNGSVIAVAAATAGTAGNSILMSKTGAGLTLVQLSGGVNASTVTVAGHILTESTDYNATVSNDSTATSLASAIHALTEVNASASTNNVNILAASIGSAGNSITLATSDAVNLAKSASTLLGGTDKYACTVSGTGSTAQKTVNTAVMSGAVGEGANALYHDQSTDVLTSSYVYTNFHFHANNLTLINDETSGNKTISLSWDGVNVHGSLLPGQSLGWNLQTTVTGIWLKYVNAAPNYRLYVLGS